MSQLPSPHNPDRQAPTGATTRAATPRAGAFEDLLTVAEVAATLRVSRMTVYRLVHTMVLPAVRIGRSYRVPRDALHGYLAEGA